MVTDTIQSVDCNEETLFMSCSNFILFGDFHQYQVLRPFIVIVHLSDDLGQSYIR
jgi:hypothetical protein